MGNVLIHGISQQVVTTFNGYYGDVKSKSGDYTASMITTDDDSTVQKKLDSLESTKADSATTLAGYGITDGYTAVEGAGLDARLTSAENSISTLTNGKLSITNVGQNVKTTDYNDIGIYYGAFDDCPGDSTQTWGAMIVLFLPFPYITKVYIKQIWNGKIQIYYNNTNKGWIQLH